MKKRSVNFMIALGAFALSAAWAVLTYQLKIPAGTNGLTGASFPKLIVSLMMLFSAIISVQEFVAMRKDEEKSSFLAKGDILRVLTLIVIMIVYSFLLKVIGFVFSTMILLLSAMLLYGNKNKLVIILVTVLLPVGLKFLFEYVLKVLLP